MDKLCWCESGQPAAACCAPLLEGLRTADTAEALMRSRYSAYVTGNASYLLSSWHPSTRPERLELMAEQKWLGLKIYAVSGGLQGDEEGVVEFAARFKVGGKGHRLRERSRFVSEADSWYYLEGHVVER